MTSNDDVTIIKSTETLSPSDHVTNRIALLENCQAKSNSNPDVEFKDCKAGDLACHSNSMKDCRDQHQLEVRTELELMVDKIKVKRDKNTQIYCSQNYKKKSHRDMINSPIRSINEVLRYNNRESPIKKKAISKVKMMVKELENPTEKDSSRPAIKSLRKSLKKNEKKDAGASQSQPQISTFLIKK